MNHIAKLETLLKEVLPFSILVLGKKGTGKSSAIKKIATDAKTEIVVASCASFADDTMAESALFGHKKNSFTGAAKDHKGYFVQANDGILFFDEIHTLSKRVQEKLLLSLQTESSGPHRGRFRIQPLGSEKAEFVMLQPVFASNTNLVQLKKKLLPDFYDRISQIVIEFPTLNEIAQGGKILNEFMDVWEKMQFKERDTLPALPAFNQWLQHQHFSGNYRDLDTISILWNKARQFFKSEEECFEFVKEQFEKYHSHDIVQNEIEPSFFRKGLTKREIDKLYRLALYRWAFKAYNGVSKDIAVGLDYKRPDLLLK